MAEDLINRDIQDQYYDWLVELVENQEHWALLEHLHKRPFYWSIPYDENRAMDGEELRDRFMYETHYIDYKYTDMGCTILELLIGIAVRINDVLVDIDEEDTTSKWFWKLLDNLGLSKFSDENFFEYGGYSKIDRILDRFLERRYKKNGEGGLFPLRNPQEDQRQVEIWYQMSSYLIENYDMEK